MPAHAGQILFRAVFVGEKEHNRDKREESVNGEETERAAGTTLCRNRRTQGRLRKVDRNFRGFGSLISATNLFMTLANRVSRPYASRVPFNALRPSFLKIVRLITIFRAHPIYCSEKFWML